MSSRCKSCPYFAKMLSLKTGVSVLSILSLRVLPWGTDDYWRYTTVISSPPSVSVCPEKKKRKTRGDHFKQRFRKNFTTLLEEEVGHTASLFSCSLIGWGCVVSWLLLCPLIGRTCRRGRSRTTCLQRPLPRLCPPVTSAVSVVFPLTTPVPPVGGATAAASVYVLTERPGTHTRLSFCTSEDHC